MKRFYLLRYYGFLEKDKESGMAMSIVSNVRGAVKCGGHHSFISLLVSSATTTKALSTTAHGGWACLSAQRLLLSSQYSQNVLLQKRNLADVKKIKDKVEKASQVKDDTLPDPSNLAHFKTEELSASKTSNVSKEATVDADKKGVPPIGTYVMPHPIWTEEQVNNVHITHKKPEGFVDKMAFGSVQLLRGSFDLFSGFKFGQRNERKWLNRICFLETVAGVPGMVAAMMRHMRSLRRMQRDQGWIHTLLEEAENERMHLLTALQLKKPSLLFRLSVIGSQGVFVTLFGVCYIFSPKFCHRFVGYLEEEAVKTYTKCLEDIDHGPMQHWKSQPAPDVAVRYWKLKPDATMRDVILAIRADEAHHRVVNHNLASLRKDAFNPYKPGE